MYAVLTSGLITADLPIPIELLRGVVAFFIACFIAKALNIFDIETRKKIEQQSRLLVQAEKLASLGQLAAGIAHEINNPLTNASLGVQTLKRSIQVDGGCVAIVEKLDAVERNIDQASVIAQELLQFSSQRESAVSPIAINEVIQGTLTLLQYKLRQVAVEYAPAQLPEIIGDAGKLQQVFINIISNSIEAMPEGGTVSIATFAQGDELTVKISDTGTGIKAENISKVFDPFFTTKEIGSGTGLGLYLCYGIIRQHKGSIGITSTPGMGTILTINLPTKGRNEKNTDCR